MVRNQVERLVKMGPLPSEQESIRNTTPVEKYQQLLLSIAPPLTDEEACALTAIFGIDGCFGLGWTLLHLIETAPNWPIEESLRDVENEWIATLKNRAERGRQAGSQ
jgi:hypothetical protein